MAIGDVVSALQSIASGAYLDIRPSSGVEWVIHNIYHEDAVELSLYNGTLELLFDVDTGVGVWAWMEYHCNNTIRIRAKNIAGTAKLIGYDGMQTK